MRRQRALAAVGGIAGFIVALALLQVFATSSFAAVFLLMVLTTGGSALASRFVS